MHHPGVLHYKQPTEKKNTKPIKTNIKNPKNNTTKSSYPVNQPTKPTRNATLTSQIKAKQIHNQQANINDIKI